MNDEIIASPIKYKKRKIIVTVIFIIFWLFATLGSITNAIMATSLARDVLANNTEVVSVILDKEHKVTTGRKGRETHKYYLTLQYNINNKMLTTNNEVDIQRYDKSTIGDAATIVYLNTDPKEAGFIDIYEKNSDISSHLLSLLGVPIIFFIMLYYVRKLILWVICRG